MRLKYIYVLKYRIEQFRQLLIHFTTVCKTLFIKKKIGYEQYRQVTRVIIQKRVELEKEVKVGTITLSSLEKDMKALRLLLSKLGYASYAPTALCKGIAGKRVCGLHPNYFYFNWKVSENATAPAPNYQKTYIKNGLFKRVVYTRQPSVVTQLLEKNTKTKIIRFYRRSVSWSARVVRMSKQVRKYAWTVAVQYLYSKSSKARRIIQKQFGIVTAEQLSKALSTKHGKVHLIRIKKVLRRKYKKLVRKAITAALRTAEVKKLQTKYKPSVQVKEYPSHVKEEMMRLPSSVFHFDDQTLIQLLSAKFKTGN
jgi:hypothetical protein